MRSVLKLAYLVRHPPRLDRVDAELNRALALAASFRRRGHDVRIVAGYTAEGRALLAASSPARALRSALKIAAEFRGAVRAYGEGAAGADVVILAVAGPLSTLAGWRALRGTGLPLVLHVADVPSLYEVEKTGSRLAARLRWVGFRQIEKRLYRAAAHIVVVSPAFKREIAGCGVDPDKISVLTNAVDRRRLALAVPATSDSSRLAAQRSGFKAIYAGNMSDHPGLDLLLDVAQKLRGSGITFVMVGDGPERTRLEERARAEQLTNVAFVGGRRFEECAGLVAACDVALVPLLEGLRSTIPSKIYLALAVGTPVVGIGPVRGALAELIGLTGCGVMASRDPGQVAETLGGLAASPASLAQFKAQGAAWAGRFDSDTVYGAFAGIVEALADGRRVEPADNLRPAAAADRRGRALRP